jgi:hypothetical protein
LLKRDLIVFAGDSSQLGVLRALKSCIDVDSFSDDQTTIDPFEVIFFMVDIAVLPWEGTFCGTRPVFDSVEHQRYPPRIFFRIVIGLLILYALGELAKFAQDMH